MLRAFPVSLDYELAQIHLRQEDTESMKEHIPHTKTSAWAVYRLLGVGERKTRKRKTVYTSFINPQATEPEFDADPPHPALFTFPVNSHKSSLS